MKRVVVAAVLGLAVILLAGAVAFAAARGDLNPAPGRQTVPAPIDQVQVVIRESNPPQVTLNIKAGLPSGCAQRESHSVGRNGDTFTVSVLNSMPTANVACTMIYGTYELNIDLGRDFRPGATYTVQVNDKTTTFKT
ncbi:MAG: hypothetical protein ACRDF9_02230 [Candidatus Limnocylindria bacterium]